jgi:glycine C-acetyltransferase
MDMEDLEKNIKEAQ